MAVKVSVVPIGPLVGCTLREVDVGACDVMVRHQAPIEPESPDASSFT